MTESQKGAKAGCSEGDAGRLFLAPAFPAWLGYERLLPPLLFAELNIAASRIAASRIAASARNRNAFMADQRRSLRARPPIAAEFGLPARP
jgi:hypothetical protein